ncbi:MAG: putative toxin-antitoxin system toxin component, PIN family [bacterium]|nr:putative toxin-antitoxin system toxin component, PIN family [bacterium]
MIRVVADTNVYVSAIVFGGTPEAILALARAGVVHLFVCPAILAELRSVLSKTFGWPESRVRDALAEVRAVASLVRPSARISGVLAHEADHRILEYAVAARVDFLVTGDRTHLLPLGVFEGIRIVTPREFIDNLAGAGTGE